MWLLKYVLLVIAIDVAIVIVWSLTNRDRKGLSYEEYLERYGSVADNYPDSYSNPSDYMQCSVIRFAEKKRNELPEESED